MAYSSNALQEYGDRADMSPSPSPPPYNPRDGDGHLTPNPNHPYGAGLSSSDPRSSSTQSLTPTDSTRGRRKLLLIYIHGFNGNETSFRSFPAHVHNLLSIILAETHVIHTKIYPKYPSRRTIEVASDNFSKWLAPHESPDTDVVLLAHSMGGILAAEVILLPPFSPATGRNFRHRIVGCVNFDVPFLGMHPGVISTGLKSLFESKEDASGKKPTDGGEPTTSVMPTSDITPEPSQGTLPQRINTLFSKPSDPNYNPAFANDIHLPIRKKWDSAMHFLQKHSDGLLKASQNYVKSHIEFSGTMADYPTLKRRYNRVRALEERDEQSRKDAMPSAARPPPRVRFVNYYTASSGRPKTPKSPQSPRSASTTRGDDNPSRRNSGETEMHSLAPSTVPGGGKAPSVGSLSSVPSPRISVEEHREDAVIPKIPDEPLSPSKVEEPPAAEETAGGDTASIASVPSTVASPPPSISSQPSTVASPPASITDSTQQLYQSSIPTTSTASAQTLPTVPNVPQFPDLTQFSDRASRKKAEKEYDVALKEYKRAVKERNTAIKANEKAAKKAGAASSSAQSLSSQQQTPVASPPLPSPQPGQHQGFTLPQPPHIPAPTPYQPPDYNDRRPSSSHSNHRPSHDTDNVSTMSRGSATASLLAVLDDPRATVRKHAARAASTLRDLNPATGVHHYPSTTSPSEPARPTSPQHAPPTSPPSSSAAAAFSPLSPSTTANSANTATTTATTATGGDPSKPPKDRKFCMLPARSPATGQRDPAWVRVFMEGIDEVAAHTGLFFLSETYERLVGDVAARVEGWLREAEGEQWWARERERDRARGGGGGGGGDPVRASASTPGGAGAAVQTERRGDGRGHGHGYPADRKDPRGPGAEDRREGEFGGVEGERERAERLQREQWARFEAERGQRRREERREPHQGPAEQRWEERDGQERGVVR